MFCFLFSQNWSSLCLVTPRERETSTLSEPAVALHSSFPGLLARLSMRVTLAVTAWLVSIVSSYSYSGSSLPDINNETFIRNCVHIHNKLRSEVKPTASGMLYMVRKIPVFVAQVCQKQLTCLDLGGKSLVIVNDFFHCD